ncbi:PEGA domain-containing protein [Candidatus Berkelbacteria bacterium]|nr:PEGA domain-containing protein [Candidatus Berkelbacteria bacterium]
MTNISALFYPKKENMQSFNQPSRLFFVSFWTIGTLVFVLGSLYVIMLASGYRFNFKARRMVLTGLILIKSEPAAEIFLDNKFKGKTPLKISYLLPGWRSMELKAPHYRSLTYSFLVEPGQAVSKERWLFLENPKELEWEESDKRFFPRKPEEEVRIIENELWYQEKLVARFSRPLLSAFIYPQGFDLLSGVRFAPEKSLIYQVEDELHLIEKSGANDLLVTNLWQNDKPVEVADTENGKVLLFKQGDSQKKLKIR